MERVEQQLQAAAREAAAALRAAGIEPEAIAEYVPPKKRLFGTRKARIEEVARGWKLGVLLLVASADGSAGEWRTGGATLRARTPPPVLGYTSESARERDELRHCAIRGGFAEGETVHWGTAVIEAAAVEASSAPLALRDGELVVRWAPGAPLGSAMPFDRYLAERLELAR